MRFRLITVALLLFGNQAAFAHHSYAAEFDRDSPITIEGVVTEVWFKSPHVRYYIKVTDEDGKFTFKCFECLGHCSTAPMMLVDEEKYENLTPESLDKVLEALS